MTNETMEETVVAPEAQIEAIKVIDESLIAQRALIAEHLSATYQALAAFLATPKTASTGL